MEGQRGYEKVGRETRHVKPCETRTSELDDRRKIRWRARVRREKRERRSDAKGRVKAREIGKRGHWLFVARSTYGNQRYGPTIGMRSSFPFCVSPVYLVGRSRRCSGGKPLAGTSCRPTTGRIGRDEREHVQSRRRVGVSLRPDARRGGRGARGRKKDRTV